MRQGSKYFSSIRGCNRLLVIKLLRVKRRKLHYKKITLEWVYTINYKHGE
jgi:hypothetical protein